MTEDVNDRALYT